MDYLCAFGGLARRTASPTIWKNFIFKGLVSRGLESRKQSAYSFELKE
jgi:hypothetical protein